MMPRERKRFYTLFPEAENVHLIKDVGTIPYLLCKKYGWDARVASYKNGEYPYLEDVVKGLKIEFLNNRPWRKGRSLINGALFLLKKSKEIDILHLFHAIDRTVVWGTLYKTLAPGGVLYLKLDTSVLYLQKKESGFRNRVRSYFFNRYADIISYESHNIRDMFIEKYKIKNTGKMIYIPNGYVKREIGEEKFPKENIIITVGRIGAKEKNNEMLLNAIALLGDIKDWKVYFVGPVEDSFTPVIRSFFAQNPQFGHSLFFTGNISNRNELLAFYRRAKICCLTSLRESFGIVLVEAISEGNFLITTPLPSIDDLSDNRKYAFVIHNETELADRLSYIMNHPRFLDHKEEEIKKFAEKNFSWDRFIDTLYHKITDI